MASDRDLSEKSGGETPLENNNPFGIALRSAMKRHDKRHHVKLSARALARHCNIERNRIFRLLKAAKPTPNELEILCYQFRDDKKATLDLKRAFAEIHDLLKPASSLVPDKVIAEILLADVLTRSEELLNSAGLESTYLFLKPYVDVALQTGKPLRDESFAVIDLVISLLKEKGEHLRASELIVKVQANELQAARVLGLAPDLFRIQYEFENRVERLKHFGVQCSKVVELCEETCVAIMATRGTKQIISRDRVCAQVIAASAVLLGDYLDPGNREVLLKWLGRLKFLGPWFSEHPKLHALIQLGRYRLEALLLEGNDLKTLETPELENFLGSDSALCRSLSICLFRTGSQNLALSTLKMGIKVDESIDLVFQARAGCLLLSQMCAVRPDHI